ncbi:MAG: ZPR1 zinc finger domain-containing protein [Candidatus Thalassarchaeaceae archaeon]|nr:ZPR1 zinc finger domain-containing protein [Candidatus Thalassarchaeaceae archaeon]
MQSKVDAPCPQCTEDGSLTMLANSSEIPYFGEHTQITVLCASCGWKHTDFIPSDGERPGFSSLVVNDGEKSMARVVRSSSCTIRIPELDLEVSPGGSSSGYVTNVEGVFTRFENAIETIIRGEDGVEAESAKQILERLQMARVGGFILTIELLDPRGRSQIIHSEATSRELGEDEKEVLESGPEIPVFDLN